MKSSFVILALLAAGSVGAAEPATVLVEAEQFQKLGGWVVDQQFMDEMGSPYLLAHGLGTPVADATTTVDLPAAGTYHIWVRTRDWVATWNAPGAPGKFQLVVNGQPLKETFGTEGAAWHWQSGGAVDLPAGKVTLALKDLTGFEGRCDAIVLSTEKGFIPPNKAHELTTWRRKLLGLPEKYESGGEFDLVVVGGGIAGTCAALSAARLDLKVALVQDRPVLGGNNSSEVRVWLGGDTNFDPYPRIGDVVKELDQKARAHYGPSNRGELYEDEKKLALVQAEKNITLLLNHRANGVSLREGRIATVVAQDVISGRRVGLDAKFVADCTGDAAVGFLAKADFDMTPKGHMGPCNLWNVAETPDAVAFPRCPWALDLSQKPFPGRGPDPKGLNQLGGWYWESGFDHDPFEKREYIRDWNFRAMYGAWDAIKNVDKAFPNHKLNWSAYVAGPRESRRLLGDVVLTKEDVVGNKAYDDGCVPATWHIDLHLPDPKYEKGFEGDAFISRAHYSPYKRPYWVPYRCLYSRNVPNLFMAGRDVSVTHEGLGAVRVMRTGGMMGEVVGMAASICRKHQCDPRDVHGKYLDELKELLRRGVGKPGARHTQIDSGYQEAPPPPPAWLKDAGPNLAPAAKVTVSGSGDEAKAPPALLTDGKADLRDNTARWLSDKQLPHRIELAWPQPQPIAAVRVISGFRDARGKLTGVVEGLKLSYESDGAWKDVPEGRVGDNTSTDWHARFPPVAARRLRIEITATPGEVSRIWEVEVYGK